MINAILLGTIGFTEILVILLVILLLFGPNKLPELIRNIGKGVHELKKSINVDEINEIKKEFNEMKSGIEDSLKKTTKPRENSKTAGQEPPPPG
jgi:sec-independent protein translocase protein TatA